MSQYSFLDLDDPPVLSNPLRERTFSQMWNETWDIFSAHWRRWIVLGLIASAPPLLVSLLLHGGIDLNQLLVVARNGSTEEVSLLTQQLLSSFIISALVGVLSWGYTLIVSSGAGAIMASQILGRKPVSLRAALRTAFTRRAGALLGANLLVGLALLGVMLASMALTTCLVGIVGFVFLIFMAVAWIPLINPLVALERGPLTTLLSRAWYFGRGRVWIIVAVLFSLSAVTSIVRAPASLLQNHLMANTISYGAGGEVILSEAYWLWRTLFVVVSLIEQSVVLPIGVILYTIMYYDARARLDSPDADLPIQAGDPPRPPVPWLVKRDVNNMLGVVMVVFGLAVALSLSSGLLLRL